MEYTYKGKTKDRLITIKLLEHQSRLYSWEEKIEKNNNLNYLNQLLNKLSSVEKEISSFFISPLSKDLVLRNKILDKIKYLELEILNKIRNIKQIDYEKAVNKIFDEESSNKDVISEIKRLEEELKKATNDINEGFKKQEIENNDLSNFEIKENLRMKKNEHWANIINGFIKKESISSLLGGLLLFIYGIGLLIAMFKKVETSQIIQSSFLIILGYFFGHSTNKNKDE